MPVRDVRLTLAAGHGEPHRHARKRNVVLTDVSFEDPDTTSQAHRVDYCLVLAPARQHHLAHSNAHPDPGAPDGVAYTDNGSATADRPATRTPAGAGLRRLKDAGLIPAQLIASTKR